MQSQTDIRFVDGKRVTIKMRKRSGYADTSEEAMKLTAQALDEQIAHAKWRVSAVSNAGLRNTARKRLAMLEQIRAARELVHNS